MLIPGSIYKKKIIAKKKIKPQCKVFCKMFHFIVVSILTSTPDKALKASPMSSLKAPVISNTNFNNDKKDVSPNR